MLAGGSLFGIRVLELEARTVEGCDQARQLVLGLGQPTEDLARQTCPEVGVCVMPCVEGDLLDRRAVIALRRLRPRGPSESVDPLLHVLDEEALACSPPAEQADRQWGENLPRR